MSIKFKKAISTKVAITFLSFSTALFVSGASIAMPLVANADTISDLQAQIAALQAQLAALSGSSSGSACAFTRDLTVGSKGDDVKCLQGKLKVSPQSGFFGPLTKAAVAKWQKDNGVSPAAGYFGAKSRAKYAATAGTGAGTGTGTGTGTGIGTTPPPAPVGTGLRIDPGTQPANSLAPKGAARIPFTVVKLTAGTDGDVTVNGLTVQRTGLAADAAFQDLVLLDENGAQLDLSKTLNSDHKATIGGTFTVKAGQTRTLTVAGNTAADTTNQAGQVAYLSVIGVNTSATVTGSLPIAGAGHTINASLTIGTVTMDVGPLDPRANQSKKVGDTDIYFSSVKVTAGSAERVILKSIRWNQSSSAAASDLANVKTYVDGTAYDTTVSSDGKYYTTSFGSGLLIDKGFSKELAIKGDLASGSGRGADFDIFRRNDLYAVGETYGYGILPPNGTDTSGTDDSAFHDSTNPWYDASEVSIGAGSITVTKAVSVAAQNVAVNVSNQPLGGIDVEVKGEPISVAKMVFRFNKAVGSGASASTQDLTSVVLANSSGSVVAGPVDIATLATAGGSTQAVLTFTDSVTFPVGKQTYSLKGKIGTDFATDDTIAASTTPSSDWTTVTGQVTGVSVTPTSGTVTASTMTVKSAALTISASTNPPAQTVVAGAQGFVFANFTLDATASGEDLRMVSIPLAYDSNSGAGTSDLTGCGLYDSNTLVSTNSNSTPTTGSSTSYTFTGTGITIVKGTVKTLQMKCNIAAGSSGHYAWGFDSGSTPSATGLTSGQSATITKNDSVGQYMTAASAGTMTVVADASSPSYTIAAAGTTATLGVLKFHATNEAINLKKVSLQLSGAATSSTGTASSSPNDLTQVTLWDGLTQVGTAIYTGTNRNATSTLTADFIIPKDGDKLLTIKGSLAAIGTSQPGTQGSLLQVDYDGADSTGTQGVGVSSGSTINQGSSSDTAVSGVRMFKGYPSVAKITSGLPTNYGGNQTGYKVYRFSVTANQNDASLFKFTFRISTSTTPQVPGNYSTTTFTNLKVYGYTSSDFVTSIAPWNDGQLNSTAAALPGDGTTDIDVTFNGTGGPTDQKVTVPMGSTYYFEVRGDITLSGGPTNGSVTTQLQGDSAYPANQSFTQNGNGGVAGCTLMGTTTAVNNDTNNNFIWSPNATTTSVTQTCDWTNGYRIPGLPSSNLDAYTIVK